MEEIIEKKTIKGSEKVVVDPNIQLQKLRFWARLLISLMAFALFGWLIFTMVQRTEELTQSSKDLINLGFGAFLPILGMLGKHWFEQSHEDIRPSEPPPQEDNNATATSTGSNQEFSN